MKLKNSINFFLESLTEIYYKNIVRYLNLLEDQELIDKEIYQDKKRRHILNSLTLKGIRFITPQFYQYFLKSFYES